MPWKSLSLVWRVLLFTSLITVALFSASAYLLGAYALHVTRNSLQDEIAASLREVELQWRTRAASLARASLLLSRMSDVRSAFLTRDTATIRDTANDMWSQVSGEHAIFLILDPQGRRLASLGNSAANLTGTAALLERASPQFPDQASGFVADDDTLFFLVVTPVYVDSSAGGQAVINILITGFPIDDLLARSLSPAGAHTDFVFSAQSAGNPHRVAASTLPTVKRGSAFATTGTEVQRRTIGDTEYAVLGKPLLGLDQLPLGRLNVMKSLAPTNRLFHRLELQILWILLAALVVSLALTYTLMRRISKPIRELDRGATEISLGNYDHRIAVAQDDELGRLARTFNSMCDSLEASRKELISQERINTIGRLSSSIVHDLRNPLAAIYGGAELLADDDSLEPHQSKRLAASIYRASRHIQELLKGLADSSRGRAEFPEVCQLREVVTAAADLLTLGQSVTVEVGVSPDIELPLERSRMERVFLNLLSNSLEAMKESGGRIQVTAREESDAFVVEVEDTGSGITDDMRQRLFQPFFSQGKKNGLGLGLALSRQTVLDHGGSLWEEPKSGRGARFLVKLPKPDNGHSPDPPLLAAG